MESSLKHRSIKKWKVNKDNETEPYLGLMEGEEMPHSLVYSDEEEVGEE
jgi:hypothetical protein